MQPPRLASLATALLSLGAAAQDTAPATPTIVVTATRHAMLALDAPAAMSVVTREQIEARGAEDVLDALRGETGVSLQGRSIGGRKVISLRGMDSKHTLYLVDGQRIAASDGTVGHSDFQYDWIPVADIERIEVVRGPLSVLYGSEAMGGVVNVITRQAGDRWQGSGRLEGSQASGDRGGDGHRASAAVSGPLAAGWALRAGGAVSQRDPVTSADDPLLSELEGHDKRDGWLGLSWQPTAAHRVDLTHREGSETRTAQARERSGAKRYHRTDNLLDRRLDSLGWEADWGRATTQLRAYETVLDVVNERTEGVAVNTPQRLTDRVLDGQWRQPMAGHALTAGFEAHNETLADPGLPGGTSLARHRALYLQDELSLSGTLDLTLGLRHDDHSLFGGEFSPRLYAVWRAAPGWVVKGGVSHGFKAPNLKQIVPGGRREGPNIFLGNPDLKPEPCDALELGAAWAEGGRELQVMAFEQRVHDLIEVELVEPGPAPGLGTYTYRNLARATLRGVETSGAVALGGGFATRVAWTWLQAEDGDGRPLQHRPRHTVGAQLDWSQGPWAADLRVDYSGMQWLPGIARGAPDVQSPDLTLVGARLARDLGAGLTLSLGVDNLTNLRPADKSASFTHAEAPRTWKLALSGHW